MRKPAPALILTTLVAFASGSALALGDRAKEKKAEPQSMTQPAASANATTPGSNPSPSALPKATTDGSSASPAATPAASTGVSSPPSSSMAVTTDGATTKPDMSKMKKDGKCDESRYPSKSAMPLECSEKVSPGK